MTTKANTLHRLLNSEPPLIVPFAYDAFSAKLIEAAGFPAAGISGSSVAASAFGLPDVGLLSREDVVGQSRRIAAAVTIPVFADADTGYGGPLQAAHTIRAMEDAGLGRPLYGGSGRPQTLRPSRGHGCHPHGRHARQTQSRPWRAHAIKISSSSPAPTPSRAKASQGAAKRARAYLDAGADMAFFAGPSTVEELEQFPETRRRRQAHGCPDRGWQDTPPPRRPTRRHGLHPHRLLRPRHRRSRQSRRR